MTLSAATIASGVAGITVTGVTFKDITAIPEQVQPRDCPIMFPQPNGWLSGGNGEPNDGPATFGTPTTRYWLFNRKYEYVYLHAPVGSGRGLVDHYSGMAAKLDLIITALLALDMTQVDLMTVDIGAFGTLQDPAGSNFFGFTLGLTFREKVNP